MNATTAFSAPPAGSPLARAYTVQPPGRAQRLLQALLGLPAPRYHHHRLLLAPAGRRLAKRDRAETLAALRESGVDGPALAARLARLDMRGPDTLLSPA